MTKKASPLNASAITLPIIPECLYHPSSVTPEWFYQGSMVFKTKEKARTWIPDKKFRE